MLKLLGVTVVSIGRGYVQDPRRGNLRPCLVRIWGTENLDNTKKVLQGWVTLECHLGWTHHRGSRIPPFFLIFCMNILHEYCCVTPMAFIWPQSEFWSFRKFLKNVLKNVLNANVGVLGHFLMLLLYSKHHEMF